MAPADVALLQSLLGRLTAQGYQAIMPLVHPDFVMETLPGIAAEPQVYRGREGMRRWWESFYEVMDRIELRALEYRDAGPGQVAIEFELAATGQTSGLGVTQRAFALTRLRDGMLERFEFFASMEDALAAASGTAERRLRPSGAN